MKRTKHSGNLLIHCFILVTILATAKSAEAEVTMEAAFQGHCGHTSPCEQLCYEIHDGMYECDCIEGYELNKNGYSCQVINSTSSSTDGHSKSDEDVLYQKGASFSAKLMNDSERDNKLAAIYASASAAATSANMGEPSSSLSMSYSSMASAASATYSELTASASSSAAAGTLASDDTNYNYDYSDDNIAQQQKVNSNDYYISAESINFNQDQQRNADQQFLASNERNDRRAAQFVSSPTTTTTSGPTSKAAATETAMLTPEQIDEEAFNFVNQATYDASEGDSDDDVDAANSSSGSYGDGDGGINDDYYNYKADTNIYDDVNNNQLNIRPINSETYQTHSVKNHNNINNNNNKLNLDITTKKKSNKINVATLIAATVPTTTTTTTTTTTSINNISNELSVHSNGESSETFCNLDCGHEGICDSSDGGSGSGGENNMRCLCTFGKMGNGCADDIKVRVPKFSKKSWLAFPALRGAYKHVQIRVEFRPESFDGIILLSGERDDLTGDFMALLLNKGFVEFWFDCGSGAGSVRSRETIMLNEWNSVIIYRHRWDAWLVLNHGTKVQGRSNGLFSRITFREPVFLGGTGNITGLAKRLPVVVGFVGCIRRFVANEHEYKFEEHPLGDVTKGFDIQDCITDKCVKYPCQHGGKCLPSDQGAVCLCPLGFVGDLCEIRMDLQVPAFNGSSYLRYAPLGDSALIWLELRVILKPEQADGLILYSGPEKHGDFIALYLNNGFVEFAFDLGSGPAVVRSQYALNIGQWHTIKISRTARLAVLKIDEHQEVMTISTNGFWHLSLSENLFVGGVNHIDKLPMDLKYKSFFVGCIQRIEINGHSLGIVSEALGGTNIGNCPHACVARPCGPLAECVPQMESYECRCSAYNERCNKALEVPPEELQLNKDKAKNKHGSHGNDNNENSSIADAGHHHHQHQQQHNSRLPLQTKYDAIQQQEEDDDEIVEKQQQQTKTKKLQVHKKQTKKHRYLHKMAQITMQPTTTTTRATTTAATQTTRTTTTSRMATSSPMTSNEEIEDDIIYRDVHGNGMHHRQETEVEMQQQQQQQQQQRSFHSGMSKEKKPGKGKVHHHHKHSHTSHKHDPHHKPSALGHKLSRLPTHYESFQTNPDSDILTFDDNIDWVARLQQEEQSQKPDADVVYQTDARGKPDVEPSTFTFDESLFDAQDGTEEYQRKQLAQDMRRIMSNKPTVATAATTTADRPYDDAKYVEYGNIDDAADAAHLGDIDDDDDSLLTPILEQHMPVVRTTPPQTHTDWSLLKKFDLSAEHQSKIGVRKNFGACFTGIDSYFHYNDGETMSQIISYNIDLNLRIKTHSPNGVILWTGRQDSAMDDDDYLSLGIEDGYLHFRYNLGSGEVDIRFNVTKVSDGLWHRVRAIRNAQSGYLEVDGRKTATLQAPGKLKQLNTDTGLYVGGMPEASYFTRRKYSNGIVGCISEIVLAGELKLNFDPNTLGTSHNVETGLL